jgi:hypothetical protein
MSVRMRLFSCCPLLLLVASNGLLSIASAMPFDVSADIQIVGGDSAAITDVVTCEVDPSDCSQRRKQRMEIYMVEASSTLSSRAAEAMTSTSSSVIDQHDGFGLDENDRPSQYTKVDVDDSTYRRTKEEEQSSTVRSHTIEEQTNWGVTFCIWYGRLQLTHIHQFFFILRFFL